MGQGASERLGAGVNGRLGRWVIVVDGTRGIADSRNRSRRPGTRPRPDARLRPSGPDRPAVPDLAGAYSMDPAIVLRTAVLMLIAYLAGSIPVGVLVARCAGGTDPRTIGSGRTGGTNALRALGPRWAAVVVAGDLLKGRAARGPGARSSPAATRSSRCCAARRRWPARSGRCSRGSAAAAGVGTGVGTMLVIQPVAVLLAAPVFILVILLTRYVSLGSLLGFGGDVPGDAPGAAGRAETPLPYVLYSAVGAALIWLAHADNIDRLLHGTERKFDLGLLAGKRPSGGG